ncbi:MAG: Lrp/AsnC family transcriptional regulator [Parvularculaceae bacterium]
MRHAAEIYDDTDRKLLAALQQNCRQSAQELADATGLSAATCWRRLKALEDSGVIKAYRAILDRARAGFAVTAFVNVMIERQYTNVIEEIENKIRARPEVLECYATTGDSDFTLRVVARDIQDYDRFLQKFLLELPEIGQVRSSIALREVKETTVLPVAD